MNLNNSFLRGMGMVKLLSVKEMTSEMEKCKYTPGGLCGLRRSSCAVTRWKKPPSACGYY